jgi:hypothetical protein
MIVKYGQDGFTRALSGQRFKKEILAKTHLGLLAVWKLVDGEFENALIGLLVELSAVSGRQQCV